MKMYGGGENNIPNNNIHNINHSKETQHISPHIAAHKSSGNALENNIPDHLSVGHHEENETKLTQLHSLGHIPAIKRELSASMYKEDDEVCTNTTINSVRAPSYSNASLHLPDPEDLSSNTKFLIPVSNDNGTLKGFSQINSVDSLSNGTSVIIAENSRTPVAIYRFLDGTTISAAVPLLFTPVSGDNIESLTQNIEGIHTIQVPCSGSSTISLQGVNSSVSEGSYIIPDVMTSNFVQIQEGNLIEKNITNTRNVEWVKEEHEIELEPKDLVRQALQEAVAQNPHARMSPSNQAIEYNYSSEDIGDLLMMNINPSASSGSKVAETVVVGSDPTNHGDQVIVIQPGGEVMGQVSHSMMSANRPRRRARLSAEAQANRREKIANRMREKRANESEEQKEKRRLREAERMRKKRANEDEIAKEMRRREAADRARSRRAKLSVEEREEERKKAALRMRLRRQNEDDEQKNRRRIKAAERMRKRRATETPEQKANRKSNHRVKGKKKKKEPIVLDDDPLDIMVKTTSSHREMIRDQVIISDHQFSRASHPIVLSPSRFQGGMTVYNGDDMAAVSSEPLIEGTIVSTLPVSVGMSTIDFVPHSQHLSVRSASPITVSSQRCPTTLEREPPPHYPKGIYITQEEESAQNLSLNNGSSTKGNGSSTIKEATHHHLPHLLHNLSPQQDQHHHIHQTYIVQNQSHATSQSQSVQVRQH